MLEQPLDLLVAQAFSFLIHPLPQTFGEEISELAV